MCTCNDRVDMLTAFVIHYDVFIHLCHEEKYLQRRNDYLVQVVGVSLKHKTTDSVGSEYKIALLV